MSEVWLDKNSGEVFIGRKAAAPYLERRFPDNFEPDLAPLSELVDIPQLDFPTDEFELPRNTCDWTRNEIIAYGHWIMSLIEKDNKPQPLRLRHIERLRALGIGAAKNTIMGEFDNLTNFKAEIKSPFLTTRRRLDHWVLGDYIKYAATLAARLGRKPEEPDYIAAHEADEGPSIKTIYVHTGGFGKLHEYIGYPDIRGADNDKLVAWGVRVLRANQTTGIPSKLIDGLSKLKRGPAMKTIAVRFGAISAFQLRVEKTLIREEAERAEERAVKLDTYSWHVADGLFGAEILDDDDKLLVAGGLLRLVNYFLPDADTDQKRALALQSPDDFIKSLLYEYTFASSGAHGSIHAGVVEAIAMQLDIYDDIWPHNTDLGYLRFGLPDECKSPYTLGDYHRRYANQSTMEE